MNLLQASGDSVRLEGEIWTVYGEEISSSYQMELCDFVTEGETYIDAVGAASRHVNINLEGQSEARVWAFESITGKAEGNSKLFYVNEDGVDISQFTTEGTAEILPLE